MPRMKSTAQERAHRLLTEVVREHRRSPAGRFPTLKQLAGQAGVGYNTMWKVVRRLADQGVLDVRPRRGIRLGNPDALTPHHRARTSLSGLSRRSSVALRVEHDIAAGEYSLGDVLPIQKQLQDRYGVNYRTLRAALADLVEARVLEKERCRYRVRPFSPGVSGGTIVLVTRTMEGGDLSDITPRTAGHLHDLESVCAQRGIELTVAPVHYGGGGFRQLRSLVSRSRPGPGILGFIVWTTVLNYEMLTTIMGIATGTGKPVAVLDEVHRLHLVEQWRHPLVRRYTLAVSPLCGLHVGRYLLQKGHRGIAYLMHAGAWDDRIPVNRLNGLREACDAFENEAVVVPVELASVDEPDPDEIFAEVSGILERSLGTKPPPTRTSDTTGDPQLDAIRAEVRGYVGSVNLQRGGSAALEHLLARGDITAWVCFSDQLAIQCVRFLSSHASRGRVRPLLVGFDDTHDAFKARITSYNFNGKACMNAMVDFVLQPQRRIGGRLYQDAVEFDGFVNERHA